jgi:hypothetical protein
MTKVHTPQRKMSRWIAIPVGIAVAITLAYILNHPGMMRLETVRRDLAEAGYPNARVSRAQIPTNMQRCEVGQIRNKGYAYAWETDAHSGVFCLRQDGRSSSVIRDQ